jgi:hypothetical protein
MSKRSQQSTPAIKSHKHQQLTPKHPPALSEQPQSNDPPTQQPPSLTSTHKSISVPIIKNQPVSTTEPLEVGLGSAWLTSHHLRHASSFNIVQKVDLHREATLGGLEQCNKYTVMDQAGNNIFFVNEESIACCSMKCFYECRPFTLTVKDNLGTNAFVIDRDLVCSCCCGLDRLTVVTPSGQLLGTVKEEFALLRPVLAIENAAGVKVLQIKGPRWPSSCCGNQVVFQVQNLQGLKVGTISKKSVGPGREQLLKQVNVADTAHISFPSDLDPALKAVCVGLLFLIDYQFLEWTRATK